VLHNAIIATLSAIKTDEVSNMKNSKSRCLLILASLLISGFLFTSLLSYFTAHQSVITQIEQSTLPLTSDNIYSEIQRDLLQPTFISSMMAKDTFVRDWVLDGEQDESAMIRYLKEIQIHYGTETSFFVSENSRKYYHSTGVLRKVDELNVNDKWYFRVQKMIGDYEINVDTDTADKTSLAIFINHRLYDYHGKYLGAIGVGLAVNAVQELIESYRKRYKRQIYFINQQGEVTLRALSNKLPDNIYQTQGLSEFATQLLTSPTMSIEYIKDNQKHYLNSRFVPEFNWYLIVEQKENEIEGRLQNTLVVNLLVSLAISIVIIALVLFILNDYQKKIEEIATTDKLTGVANRQLFDALFQQAHHQSRRSKTTLSAIMLDIDYFKQINDTYGHPTGDVVLKTLAQTIQRSIRESDILFRWGGEEFFIILPESDIEIAMKVAEKIREQIMQLEIIFSGKSLSVTISLGVASLSNADHSDQLVIDADKALYAAKKNGRNRVERYTS